MAPPIKPHKYLTCEKCNVIFKTYELDQTSCNRCAGNEIPTRRRPKRYDNESMLIRVDGKPKGRNEKRVKLF